MFKQETLVGIIKSDEALTDLMKVIIEDAGFQTAIESYLEIEKDFTVYQTFVSQYNPRIVVIDIPYRNNWQFVDRLIASEESKERGFVLATCDAKWPKKLGVKSQALEVIEKPFDINKLAQAVNRRYQLITYNQEQAQVCFFAGRNS